MRFIASQIKITMKKLILTTLFVVVLSTLASAQTVQKTYNFDKPAVSEMRGYDVIRFDGLYNNGIVGEAALPYKAVSLLLPPNTEAKSITFEYSDFVELEGTYNIMPQQAARPLSSTEPLVFEKNEEFYRSDNVYPEVTYSKANTQYLNGCSFAFAQFTPVRYVPATGKVSYAQSVTVTVDVTASKVDKSDKMWMIPEVQGRIERLAQNPEAVQGYKNRAHMRNGYELLVITPQDWVSHFDEYVEFYEARGLRTHVTAKEDIYDNFEGRDNAEKIRNYIIQEYENNGIEMVLLGGDVALMPWRALYCFAQEGYVDELPADMYFACLDGTWDDNDNGVWGEIGEDDLLPELAVARLPFNNETQFNTIMHKTLSYQANPVLNEFRTVILGAEDLGDGYFGSNDLERIIGGSDDFDYSTVGIPEDYNIVKYYASESMVWSASEFRSIINTNGGQYIHHVGHANTGYVAGWENMDITDAAFGQLNGVDHNYNFFHSHGCICGDFSHNCILEKMVTISTGFVATTGNSRYGWYMPWGDGMAAHLHREFVDAYYNDRLPYIGTAFQEMKIMTAPYVVTSWGEENGCLRWNIYDLNIMGDVAVCPWLDEPFYPEVSYVSALTQGATSTTITVTKDGAPQSNFRCSIFHNDELIGFGLTDNNGNADVMIADGLDVADSLRLIVTGPNAWPLTMTMMGLNDNEAFVCPQNIDIHGDFEFGKAISMDVEFKNEGLVDANNVVATLSSNSDFVSMSKSSVNVGTVLAGTSVTVTDAFDINVADNIPDGTYVSFVMSCTDGEHVWNSDIYYIAKAPELFINEVTYEEINGNMNGYMEPGETFRFFVTGKNRGHKNAADAYLHGADNFGYITYLDNDVVFDDVDVNDEFTATLDITIAQDVPGVTPVMFDITVNSGQYSASKPVTSYVGIVIENFETGDFSSFDWRHDGDAEWFVTDSISYTGNYCAQCGRIGKNQRTSLLLDVNVDVDGYIEFYYKVSSTYKKDYFAFYIDGQRQKAWSGEIDWTKASYRITAGPHTLEWLYDTSKHGATGNNACWIDDVFFPGNTTSIDDVAEIIANQDIAVYPNPANDVIYMRGDDIQYVEIYNTVGMKVIAKNVSDSESIDVADFASGMYIVRAFDGKGNVSTTKFIKK